ncbi:aminodeoxychorismate synthase component I [Bacillus carboniphilus]|uniref:Aminodeoxychorismate synthase component I n=1 Tax=Bacillus carboniphilus TaxID=86663 RepID=A0ABP3FXV3_9BACI
MQQPKVYSETIPMTKEEFFSFYTKVQENYEHHILLESGRGGQYSIAGLQPFAVLKSSDNGLHIYAEKNNEHKEGNPLHLVKEWMQNYVTETDDQLPDFQGGAIGYISYDYARYIEKLPSLSRNDLEMPILYFLVFKEWVVFEHEQDQLWFMNLASDDLEGKNTLERMKQEWLEASAHPQKEDHFLATDDKLHVSMTEEQFMEAVEKIREYIAQGDVFQVNLSVRQSKVLSANPFDIYKELRILNPSPYMGYMHTPDFQIVSGSPELLIKKKGREVSTRPIAGTRSRGKDHEEDLQLARELMENEKERAEHVMLVDLERNDIGRVCEYGSVEVNEFMVIEKYSHVMHIVSNVRGTLAVDKDGFDLIEATFPGGTITGAPKIRTMEIIEELEPVQRGIYTGSIGWIGFDGNLELNIVIRTLLAKNGFGHIQAGAGVVIDSNPKHEYKEALKKAAALWKATEMAEKRLGEEK